MNKTTSNSKRLVKNTAYMYIRMCVLMCISLYTSRIVLKELGVNDFGIYNLVGSIVAMFASVRTLFSSSTQRFLNYEMGKHRYENMSDIFDTSVYINLLIAFIFIIGVEGLGLWFFQNEINIDQSRIFAAQVVFQLSLFAALIGIFTTSYDAAIIAHEKMNFYAYLSVIEGLLRLLIVFMLQMFDYDKLIMYGILTCLVSIFVLIASYFYCVKNFSECRFTFKFNKVYFRDMTGFAGWNFFGVTAYTLTQNGLNMLLNIFGGTVVNAARGLTYQISSVLNNFMANISIVLNPYGIKLYSAGEYDVFFKLFYFSSKTLFLLQSCVVIIVIFFTSELLTLWLGQVPKYTEIFLQLVLLNSIVRSLHSPLDLIFKASAQMKYYQLFEGVILSLPLLFSFFFLKMGASYSSVFVVIIFFEIVNLLVIVFLANKISSLSIRGYFLNIIIPCFLMFFVGAVLYVYAYDMGIMKKLLFLIFSIIIMIGIFILSLSSFEKQQLARLISQKK